MVDLNVNTPELKGANMVLELVNKLKPKQPQKRRMSPHPLSFHLAWYRVQYQIHNLSMMQRVMAFCNLRNLRVDFLHLPWIRTTLHYLQNLLFQSLLARKNR